MNVAKIELIFLNCLSNFIKSAEPFVTYLCELKTDKSSEAEVTVIKGLNHYLSQPK